MERAQEEGHRIDNCDGREPSGLISPGKQMPELSAQRSSWARPQSNGRKFDGVNLRSGQAYVALKEFTRLSSPSGYGAAMFNWAGPVKCSEAALPEAELNRAGADSSQWGE